MSAKTTAKKSGGKKTTRKSNAKATAKKSTARKSAPKGQKHCARCNRNRSLKEFANNKAARDGKQTYCRDCNRDAYGGAKKKAS